MRIAGRGFLRDFPTRPVLPLVLTRRAKREVGHSASKGNLMTDKQFWDIINLLDWTQDEGDEKAIVASAVRALAELPIAEIFMFDEFLCWRLYTLDTREHARSFGDKEPCYSYVDDATPFSTDSFLYSRARVIANGQAMYEAVLADPEKMPKEQEFEMGLYLAAFAYQQKTGNDYKYEPGLSWEAGANKAGWLRAT